MGGVRFCLETSSDDDEKHPMSSNRQEACIKCPIFRSDIVTIVQGTSSSLNPFCEVVFIDEGKILRDRRRHQTWGAYVLLFLRC